jgi:hypothetical protein
MKHDIHYEAERFLEEYNARQAHTVITERIANGVLQVILMRMDRPQYFCGFKADNKTPVWTYDIKLAKSIDYSLAEDWIRMLDYYGNFVFPIWSGVVY